MAPAADAASLKEQGNAEFKAGRYSSAIDAYTGAIELDPSQHTVFSNRSAAYLKIGGKAEEALKDAETCVQLAPSWPKGYSRLAAALQELSRWDEASAAVERGLKASPGDDALSKMNDEVVRRRFAHQLSGPWYGTVHEDLGGFVQEMDFVDNSQVKVSVLGKTTMSQYWLDCKPIPHHLNIRVPMDPSQLPPGVNPMQAMAMPPVPYIVRIDGDEMTLCCPHFTPERPTKFEGKGVCVMKRGHAPDVSDAEDLKSLSADEKLRKCLGELIEAVPNERLEEPGPQDTEQEAGAKILRFTKFEQARFRLEKRFGEEAMTQVLESVRAKARGDASSLHSALVGADDMLKQLESKLKNAGIMGEEEGAASSPPAPAEQQSAAPAKEAATAPVATEPGAVPAADESGWLLAAGVVVLCAAAAVAAVAYARRRR